jgi:hypothetical protein
MAVPYDGPVSGELRLANRWDNLAFLSHRTQQDPDKFSIYMERRAITPCPFYP